MMNTVKLIDIDRISYAEGLKLQHRLHDECAENDEKQSLVLLEHNTVLTCGVKTGEGNVLVPRSVLDKEGVEIFETDRGGDVTYHGPGQLVGYPIVAINRLGLDAHSYLRTLEQSIIDVLAEFGLRGERNGLAGVWVGEKKLCSIGVTIRKRVTYHGFGLNINPNMKHFYLINPCGLRSEQLSSLYEMTGENPPMAEIKKLYEKSFEKNFGVKLTTD